MCKKIMVLGGGENQLPLIKKAKEFDYKVVLCDFDPNCSGRQFCDVFCEVSIKDEKSLLRVAKNENIDGVVTNSEPVLHIVSRITEQLHLPSVPEEVMCRYTNKNLMRDCVEAAGYNNVDYRKCQTLDEAVSFYEAMGQRKAIIKPVDNSSSRGVHSISTMEELLEYFPMAKSANRRGQEVLIEEYIDGTEFTVDGICVNGKHTTLAISKKKHFSYNENVAYELRFAHCDDQYDYDALRSYNDKIIMSAGLTYGMTHSEYKYSEGKFHLIEACARGGGAFIATCIVPWLSGIDNVGTLVQCAVGDTIDSRIEVGPESKKKTAVLRFFSTPDDMAGVVHKIEGVEKILSIPQIVKFRLNFREGDYIKRAEDDSERIGYYIALADSEEELDSVIEKVEQCFKINFV